MRRWRSALTSGADALGSRLGEGLQQGAPPAAVGGESHLPPVALVAEQGDAPRLARRTIVGDAARDPHRQFEVGVGQLRPQGAAAVPSSSRVTSAPAGSSISRSIRMPVFAVLFQSMWLRGSPGWWGRTPLNSEAPKAARPCRPLQSCLRPRSG